MIFQNSIVNITFPRVENLKKIYFLNDEILKREFDEPTVLPVPDDAPSEIPRIVSTSSGGHSKLSINSEMISLQTYYTHEYQNNWELCKEYLNNKINNLFEFADKLTEGNFNYIGLMTNVIWNDSPDGTKVITEKLSKLKTKKEIYDIAFRYTFIENEKYFVNANIQNVRVFNSSGDARIAGELCNDLLKENVIGINIDVNDRYQFNNNRDYVSNKNEFANIMQITSDFLSCEIENFINKGEYKNERL